MKFGSKIEGNTQECVANILDIIKLTRDVYFDVYKVFNRYGILLNTEFTTIDPFSFKSLQETGHSLNFLSVENLKQANDGNILFTIKTDGMDTCGLMPKSLVFHYEKSNEVDKYKLIVKYVIGTMMSPNIIKYSTILSLSEYFINEKMKEQYRLLVDGNESVQCKFKEVASDDKMFNHFQRFCLETPRLFNGGTLIYESNDFHYKFTIKSLTGEDKYSNWIVRYLLTLTKENVCSELIKHYIMFIKTRPSLLNLQIINILENLLLENKTKRKEDNDIKNIAGELKYTDITPELLKDDKLSNFIKVILSEFSTYKIDECDVIRVHTYRQLNDISWKDFKKILLETGVEYKELRTLGLSDIVIETEAAYIYIEHSEDSCEGYNIKVKTWQDTSVSNFENLAEICILRRQIEEIPNLED